MTNQQEIKFTFKCSQKWDEMEATSNGKSCESCRLNIIDFSVMSNEQIIDYLVNRKNEKTCGRMSANQLVEVNKAISRNNSAFNKFRRLYSILGLSLLLNFPADASIESCKEKIEIVSNKKILVSEINTDINHAKKDSVIVNATLFDEDDNEKMAFFLHFPLLSRKEL